MIIIIFFFHHLGLNFLTNTISSFMDQMNVILELTVFTHSHWLHMKYCCFGLGFAKNKDIMEKLTTKR